MLAFCEAALRATVCIGCLYLGYFYEPTKLECTSVINFCLADFNRTVNGPFTEERFRLFGFPRYSEAGCGDAFRIAGSRSEDDGFVAGVFHLEDHEFVLYWFAII